jgi:transcriptional regulator with XRE-family HTH domain
VASADAILSLLKQQVVGAHVRRLRIDKGLTLRSLASQTGFSPSFMSQVENGQVSPSISSMEKIAEALGVTLGEFFAAAAGGEGGLVVRAGERSVLSSSWSSAEIEALGPMKSGLRLEPVLITLKPGGRSGKHPYPHANEEFAFVVEGQVRLTLGPEQQALATGDAVTILPRELRLWENPTEQAARVLVVSVRQKSGVETARPSAHRPLTPTEPGGEKKSMVGRRRGRKSPP